MDLPPDLWPNQRQALTAFFAALESGRRSGLIVQPTGTGKTRTIVEAARLLAVPALVLVHRDVLIRQTVKTATRFFPGAAIGVIQGDLDEWQSTDLFAPGPVRSPDLVIASVPSLSAARLANIPRDRFGLLVSDEAHRSVSPSWSRAIAHFEVGFHLGVTATPDRLDRRGLAVHFGREPLYAYHLHQAIADGVLVTLRQMAARTGVDLANVAEDARGKWDQADLSRHVNTAERNQVIVAKYQQVMAERRAVAFCVDCDHVHALTDSFCAAGVPAVAITGKKPEEREKQLEDFAAGKYRVAVNCEVLGEGFDDPAVSGILWARPTQSKAFLMQGIGRGLRRFPGKADCLVIDFVDVSRKHKLVTVCDLVGIRRTSDCGGEDVFALAARERAEDAAAEAQAQQQLLTYPLAWRLEEVSPWPDLPSLDGYEAQRPWQGEAATPRQLKALGRLGLAVRRDLTRGEASWLFERSREYEIVFPTPATLKQERYLRHAGAWQDGLSRREASKIIGPLKRAEAEAEV